MGIQLAGVGGSSLEDLGRVLFVSPTGSTTRTRAQALGRIDRPVSLQRAFNICQDSDTICVLPGDYPNTYTLSGRNNVSILLFGLENINIVVKKIQQLNINNCSDIFINGSSDSCFVLNIALTNCSSYFVIENVFIASTLTINNTNALEARIKDCLLQAYNWNSSVKCRAEVRGVTTYSGLSAISNNFDIHFVDYKTRKNIARANNGRIVFENSILGEGGGNYHAFDTSTGTLGSTQLSYKNCVIKNINPFLCQSTSPNITRMELYNCVLHQSITSGRLPDVMSNCTIDSNFVPGFFI